MAGENGGWNQQILITLYKTVIRSLLEYRSEIWGDISKCRRDKLESVQHRALSMSLGVNRLAHRKDVRLEFGVLPLDMRRSQTLFRSAKRLRGKDIFAHVEAVNEENKLVSKWRSSFLERLKGLGNELELHVSELLNLPIYVIRNRMVRLWRADLIAEPSLYDREANNGYKIVRTGYKDFCSSRKLMSLWHQTRCGALPLNNFLCKIKKARNRNCGICGVPEDVSHFLLK